MPIQDKTRALFTRALDSGTTEEEAKTAILQWLRRVREDGEPLVYMTREEAQEVAAAPTANPADTVRKAGEGIAAILDLVGLADKAAKGKRG